MPCATPELLSGTAPSSHFQNFFQLAAASQPASRQYGNLLSCQCFSAFTFIVSTDEKCLLFTFYLFTFSLRVIKPPNFSLLTPRARAFNDDISIILKRYDISKEMPRR